MSLLSPNRIGALLIPGAARPVALLIVSHIQSHADRDDDFEFSHSCKLLSILDFDDRDSFV